MAELGGGRPFRAPSMHVEAVAWIAERKEILSTLFGMLALLAYAAYAQSGRKRYYILVFLCMLLSLLAKPMLVTLPFLLLLLDLWPLKRSELFEPSPARADGKARAWPTRLAGVDTASCRFSVRRFRSLSSY